eukprot:747273-Hanusia_phi.AAC.4
MANFALAIGKNVFAVMLYRPVAFLVYLPLSPCPSHSAPSPLFFPSPPLNAPVRIKLHYPTHQDPPSDLCHSDVRESPTPT